MSYTYDLALSFAGEQRDIAESIAVRLDSSGYRIFYDDFERAQLWGSELPTKLGEVYGKAARFCLILISSDYVQKKWTNHERRFAISRALEDRLDYILPVKVDDSELPGMPGTIAYVDLRTTGTDELYGLLLEKLGLPAVDASESNVTSEDRERVRRLIAGCYRRAIFTRTHGEISMDAMHSSIRECLRGVQSIVPLIQTPALQFLGASIIRELDMLERFMLLRYGGSDILPPRTMAAMDESKQKIIYFLLQLRRHARIPIQLPTNLTFEFFFSAKEAAEPPRVRDRW